MAKQTFTTGQVLTAAQMTALQANDFNWTVSAKTASYVLAAADAGTRITMNSASATTITVNTALFTAGDTVFIQNIGAGACVITAGTATVTSAGSLSIPQWGGGTLYFTSASAAIFFPNVYSNGLVLIKTQTIGSGVSSIAVTSVFSSLYDNYRIVISNFAASSAGGTLNLTLNGSAGSTYEGNMIYWSTAATTITNSNYTATAASQVGILNTTRNTSIFDVTGPNLASQTLTSGFTNGYSSAGSDYGAMFTTYDTNAAASISFTLTPSAGTLTGGTIYVYGYANS